jgi:hypothetical protein
MHWELTPIVKIYEALGAVVDGRVHVEGNTAKVYSSTGNKYYDVMYDSETHAIMVNDNGSYYKGYLGYPAVAFLMQIGKLPYDRDIAERLKDVAWKDINQQLKNDFDKAIDFILAERFPNDREVIDAEVAAVYVELKKVSFTMLGKKVVPPSGY